MPNTDETLASEIMETTLLTTPEDATLEDALKLLVNSRITGLPVVDKKGKMVGVVSDYDILVQVSKAKRLKPDLFHQKIEFTRKVEAIPDTMPLMEIVSLFREKRFRRLPVINKTGKLVGVITRRDLMRLFYYRAKLS